MANDEHEHLLDCQAKWFINTPRDRAVIIWRNWQRTKSYEYMADLRKRIKKIQEH